MTDRKPAKETKSAKSTVPVSANSKGFTDEERAAMKERIQELRADKAGGESAVLAKIAQMQEPDRAMAKRLHAIIRASAPALSPRLWYGMPAYAKDDKVVCFFQAAQKFKTRYATLGFSDKANLDEGDVADHLRAEGVDCSRRGEDCCSREESGELRTDLDAWLRPEQDPLVPFTLLTISSGRSSSWTRSRDCASRGPDTPI